eukprot:5269520-Heterocapsa_arctica.AAC.1
MKNWKIRVVDCMAMCSADAFRCSSAPCDDRETLMMARKENERLASQVSMLVAMNAGSRVVKEPTESELVLFTNKWLADHDPDLHDLLIRDFKVALLERFGPMSEASVYFCTARARSPWAFSARRPRPPPDDRDDDEDDLEPQYDYSIDFMDF